MTMTNSTIVPHGAEKYIVWNYDRCVVFNPGDVVFYRRSADELQYWSPDGGWTRSIHREIPLDRAKGLKIYNV